MTIGRRLLALLATGFVLSSAAEPLSAQERGCPRGVSPVAQIVSRQGMVEIRSMAEPAWTAARLNATLCPGDAVRTGKYSRAALLLLTSETVIRVDQLTTLSLEQPAEPDRSFIDLLEGAIHFLTRVPRRLDVKTPYVTAGVKGTEFIIRVAKDLRRAYFTVFEGVVGAENDTGRLVITSGQSAVAGAKEAPREYQPVNVLAGQEIQVRSRDTVQWALHYPPAFAGPDAAVSEDVRRAATLLAVGRVDEARPIMERALSDPLQRGEALALLSVMSVARNDNDRALELAGQAIEKVPESAAAKIALSYARQARAELGEARDVLLAAAEAHPDNPLVWARLAEIWLALGYRDRALAAAEKAMELPPDLSRTQTVFGFAALSGHRREEAEVAFSRAIELDSAYPLPRLGLGLVKIKGSDLAEGRREIEIAAILNPDNALTRSYLGKAYFEERRSADAEAQFRVAKDLDPADPTPWLYDAILKLTENRPVEALSALRESIRKNDNRAVYRSRLLLDEDLAIRGAALARIYDELNFDQRAIVESTKSLTIEPSDHSAHRFLADSYAKLPRHEIARASELLQAQLLQPINIDPVQPQVAETDLNIIAGAGPADITLNEFTPMFQSDGLRLDVSGFGGNNETFGDEVVLSGIFDRFSFSAGQYHFESDGFRENNDVKHDIYNAFAQVGLTDELNVQFEYRRRRTEQGDLRLNFDPDDFFPFERRDIHEDIYRAGLHYAPDPASDFIASFIYVEGGEEISDMDEFGIVTESDGDDSSYDGQARYFYDSEDINFTAGFSMSDVDVDLRITDDFTAIFGESCPVFIGDCDLFPDVSVQQRNAYTYADVELPGNVTATMGLSYDVYEKGPLDVDRLNPKFGLQWDIDESIRLRSAYFRTVKRSLIADQTLEPTHVAGFNQFFDDVDGARTERYGVALDVTLADNLYGGIEASRRNLDVPTLILVEPATVITEDQREEIYRGYLYWAPDPEWAATAEVQFERIERDDEAGFPLPTKVETLSVPLGLNYFHPSGFYASAGLTYVRQEVGLPPGSTFGRDEDNFFLVDAAVGYRLPDQLGVFKIEARNIFNKNFDFQDPNIQAQEPSNPVYIPERTILVRLTLRF